MLHFLKYIFILTPIVIQLTPIVIQFFVPNNAPAQKSDQIDWKRMQRDLDIMETVLNSLIQPSQYGLGGFSSNGARGLYFDGYGVVFQIEFGGHSFFAWHKFDIEGSLEEAESHLQEMKENVGTAAPPKASGEKRSRAVVVDGNTAALIDRQGESVEQKIEKLKDMLVQFLGDYADAIGQLEPDDRVTLLVNFSPSSQVFVFDSQVFSESQELPATLEATVKKRDIVEYRKGNIDRDTFRERITMNTRSVDREKNKHIDILANILSTALNRKHREALAFENRNRGIYLEGLGAVFFLKGNPMNEFVAPPFEHYFEEYVTYPPKPPDPEQQDRLQKSLADFKQELIKLVADYGHTLRTLKTDEYVVVDVNFQHTLALFSDSPQQLILKVKKHDLDKYDRGELTLTQLQQKTDFIEH